MLLSVRPVTPADSAWLRHTLDKRMGGPTVVTRGVAHDASRLPGFVAMYGREAAGLATYSIDADGCQLVTIDGIRSTLGVGPALLNAVRQQALAYGCRRIWLVVTNDNTNALRYYQSEGWDLVALHHDSITRSRERHPTISVRGADGIPIRHELELELPLLQTPPA